MWRLDRQLPLNTPPEWFDTEEAANDRLVELRGMGSSLGLVVWFDTATYVPIPPPTVVVQPVPDVPTPEARAWRDQLMARLATRGIA